jgi:hypothetical protein
VTGGTVIWVSIDNPPKKRLVFHCHTRFGLILGLMDVQKNAKSVVVQDAGILHVPQQFLHNIHC